MRQKSVQAESPSQRLVKTIRRATRKRHSAEEKIRIVLDGLRGEVSIADPRDLMRPFPSEPMRMWPISTRVNKPENDDPSIVEPIKLTAA
jgi:hypothetical protein